MRQVVANDDTGKWDVIETSAGNALIASFESRRHAKEFAAVPEMIQAIDNVLSVSEGGGDMEDIDWRELRYVVSLVQ